MDSYPRCATCKHYRATVTHAEDLTLYELPYGSCAQIDADDAWMLVCRPTSGIGDCDITVEAIFGCVQHEPKES